MKVNPSIASGNVFSVENAAAKAQLRDAILRHVREHPDAADTADGILKYWLPRTGCEHAQDLVAAVLQDMVNRHWLRAQALPDGEILYLRGDACSI